MHARGVIDNKDKGGAEANREGIGLSKDGELGLRGRSQIISQIFEKNCGALRS